jgi:hypothetical protein
MTFELEYLGEFDFTFENNLRQEGSFDEKKHKSINLVQVHLSGAPTSASGLPASPNHSRRTKQSVYRASQSSALSK